MFRLVSTLINVFVYYISGFSIRNRKKVLFGCWGGKLYADNAKYMYQYLLNNDNFHLIWIGNKDIKNSIPMGKNSSFVSINSFQCIYHALTSKIVFITNGYKDVCKINILRKSTIVQLWHGGGIKRILSDSFEAKKQKRLISRSQWFTYKIGQKTFNKCNYFITSSPLREENIISAFKYFGIKEDKIIKHGQPRVDFLINTNKSKIFEIKSHYCKSLNLPIDKKIILYLPTYRDNENTYNFTFSSLKENKKLIGVLQRNNAVILEKRHIKDNSNMQYSNENSIYFDLTSRANNIDTQELLLISDILITDYSGVYLDYLNLNKPIIHYIYDYEYYAVIDRGFKYDIKNVAGGVLVYNNSELVDEIKKHLVDPSLNNKLRDKTNILMNSYEKGDSSQKIWGTILNE